MDSRSFGTSARRAVVTENRVFDFSQGVLSMKSKQLSEEVRLFEKCVFLSLTIHVIGNSAKGDIMEIETGAKKRRLRLNKVLFDCSEYENLTSYVNKIRTDIKGMCFGGDTMKYVDQKGQTREVGGGLQDLVKSGCYTVPLGMVVKVKDRIDERIPEFNNLVAKLCEVYETRKEESRKELGPQYKESDYHSVSQVKRLCFVNYKFISVGLPEAVRSVKEEIFEEEREKMRATWAEATEEVRLVLRVGLKSLIDHATDRLKSDGDGKKKKFHESMIGKMKEFLADFPGKNITNDDELATLVEQTRQVMAGKTAEKLRKDDSIRERVQERLEEVKQQLDKMIEETPSRALILEEV